MIAKITRGGSPHAIGQYLHGPGKANEHHYDEGAHGRVIGGSMAKEGDGDSQRWARQMQRLVDKRPDIAKPIHQISLSAAPSDPIMTDRQWEQIAREYMRDMGLEHNPWVVVRHDPGHVHIVASRVNGGGSVWDNKNDHYRSQKATRGIEERHRLQRVPSRTKGRPEPTEAPELVHPAERALKERSAPSWRSEIKQGVEHAARSAHTPEEFRAALKARGIGFYENKQGDLVYTIGTKNGQRKITGHKLGADYRGGRIGEHLGRRRDARAADIGRRTDAVRRSGAELGRSRAEAAKLAAPKPARLAAETARRVARGPRR